MKINSALFIKILLLGSILILLYTGPILAEGSTDSENPFILMLHFDDGYTGVYKNAFWEMQKYGYKGTVFVPTNYIDRPKHLKLEELKEMKDAGWEIGSHTRTHPDLRTLDPATLYDEIVGSRNFLEGAQLLTLDNAYFCSPMTVWNTYIAILVSKHYKAARSKELTIFDFPIQPPQHVRVILKDTSLESIEGWIKEAKRENAWLIFVFHEVAEGGNEYFFPPEKFKKVLDLFNHYQINTYTIEEAIAYWEKVNSQFNLFDTAND